MEFQIYTESPISFAVSSDGMDALHLVEPQAVSVKLSVVRDGKDGVDGDATLVTRTLEEVRNEDNTIQGTIDANGYTIENLRNASSNQEPATKLQLDAALQEAKNYADTVSAETVRWAGFHDASQGTYPSVPNIRRGDEFEISVAGTIAGAFYETGDLLRARINSPGQTVTNWSSAQGNVQQSTESRQGTAKIVTSDEIANENSVNDTDMVTAKKIWLSFVPKFLTKSWVWLAQQTFSVSPKLESLSANNWLKLNAQKEIVSVDFKPEQYCVIDVEDRVVSGIGNQAHAFYLVPANTFRVGSKIQLDASFIKTIVGNNSQITTIKHHTTPNANAGTVLVTLDNATITKEWRVKREVVIKPGNLAYILFETTRVVGLGSSGVLSGSFLFNPAVDNYFFATTSPNNSQDVFTQIFFSIKGVY